MTEKEKLFTLIYKHHLTVKIVELSEDKDKARANLESVLNQTICTIKALKNKG